MPAWKVLDMSRSRYYAQLTVDILVGVLILVVLVMSVALSVRVDESAQIAPQTETDAQAVTLVPVTGPSLQATMTVPAGTMLATQTPVPQDTKADSGSTALPTTAIAAPAPQTNNWYIGVLAIATALYGMISLLSGFYHALYRLGLPRNYS